VDSFTHSIFSNASDETIGILYLWWILAGLAGFAFFLTMIFLAISISRKRSSITESEKQKPYWLFWGIGSTICSIFVVLIATLYIKPTIHDTPNDSLKIEIIGKQWWWEIKYLDTNNKNILFETANEIVIPINTPIQLILKSADVIHSFWVPALAGKVDMVPGQTNYLTLETKKQGQFRGQCAEFCGLQHAKMGIIVSAVSPEQFETWHSSMLQPHKLSSDPIEKKGLGVFRRSGCGECHSIRGLVSSSINVGPNLSYLAKRLTLGAATIPNNRGHLASWIANPDSSKAGTLMPSTPMSSTDFQALIAFLESLK
jgi:cytochrome c oxidase subunit 2